MIGANPWPAPGRHTPGGQSGQSLHGQSRAIERLRPAPPHCTPGISQQPWRYRSAASTSRNFCSKPADSGEMAVMCSLMPYFAE